MTILIDVFRELFKMFVTDFRLTMATLASVVLVAVLLGPLGFPPLFGGPLLLVLCLGILLETVFREARKRSAK
ncbi:MAG: hypothetical protein ACC631_03790 [Halocynthiibacter sp.]